MNAAVSPARILVGHLRRERHLRVAFCATPEPPPRIATRRPAAVARMLALAHHIQRAIDAGRFADAAAVADRLAFTRARVSQLLNLVLLAPDIQESVLRMEAIDGVEPLTERSLRPIASLTSWADQRALWTPLAHGRPRQRSRTT